MGNRSNIQNTPTSWFTTHMSISTIEEITTDLSKLIATVSIQADKDNDGDIYVGSDNTVTSTGDNAGFRLAAGDSLVVPVDAESTNSRIFVIASTGTQRAYVAQYTGGELTK